jgi:hypothetical protein
MGEPRPVIIMDPGAYPGMPYGYPGAPYGYPPSDYVQFGMPYSSPYADGPLPADAAADGVHDPQAYRYQMPPVYPGPPMAGPGPVILVQQTIPLNFPNTSRWGFNSLTDRTRSGAPFFNERGVPVFSTFKKEFGTPFCTCQTDWSYQKRDDVLALIEMDGTLKNDCRDLGRQMLVFQAGGNQDIRRCGCVVGAVLIFVFGIIFSTISRSYRLGLPFGILCLICAGIWLVIILVAAFQRKKREKKLRKKEDHLNRRYAGANLS